MKKRLLNVLLVSVASIMLMACSLEGDAPDYEGQLEEETATDMISKTPTKTGRCFLCYDNRKSIEKQKL